jgi:predicted N-formylglutamate amidohydrolase
MSKMIISCEHGGFEIPTNYEPLFQGAEEVLKSHRGWDKGALEIANYLHKRSGQLLFSNTISRLLIEFNRSLEHNELFSEYSKKLTSQEQQQLIDELYIPYRSQLAQKIEHYLEQDEKVIHLSIHSFTPILNGEVRKTEIGILFDPDRTLEAEYALKWQKSILKNIDIWRVKFNYPYLGIDDGLTTYFRKQYPLNYAGIELEVNTKLLDCYPIPHIGNWLFPPMNKLNK